jgi:hypothetical protein
VRRAQAFRGSANRRSVRALSFIERERPRLGEQPREGTWVQTMTRRERLERKVEKRGEWAGKAVARSNAAYEGVRRIASAIPFGQPILVGHHSERHARRDADRIHRGMDRSVAESKLAEHHESKARGLAIALERSIFDDDPDAIERLEAKAKACDASAEQCNAINRAWRKGGRAAVAAAFSEGIAAQAEKLCAQFSWLARKGPMEATSDRAEARRCRERVKAIRAKQARAEQAEAAGGVVIAGSDTWVRVTFSEKPAREVLNALRASGYRWGDGSWQGPRSKLPEEVQELAQYLEEKRKADAGECLCSVADAYECVRCEEAREASEESA